LLVEFVLGRRLVLDRAGRAAAIAAAGGTAAPVALGHGGGGPAQARTDLVGDDLDDRALLAVVGLPRPLLEPAGHDDAAALRQRLAGVLAHRAPCDDVEERRRLLPLARLAVLPPPVDGEADGRLRLPAGREPQLRIAGDVPDDRDRISVAHRSSAPFPFWSAVGAPAPLPVAAPR